MLTNDDVVSLPLARRRRGRCRSAPEGSAGRGWAEPAPARVPRLLVGLPLAARSGAARGFTPAAAQDRGEARRRRGVPRDGHRSRASVSGRARRGRRRASAGRSRHGARPLRASAQDEPRATRTGRSARRPRPAGAPSGRSEPGGRLDRGGATTGTVDRGHVSGPGPNTRQGVCREGRVGVGDRRLRARRGSGRRGGRPARSKRAARSGSQTPTSTAATSGGRRSCSEAPSREHRHPSTRRSAPASTGRSRGCTHSRETRTPRPGTRGRRSTLLELGEDAFNTARAHRCSRSSRTSADAAKRRCTRSSVVSR